ncbi:hypothetical protein PENTCL1PPCAC_17202, partial [Pristionchus entomophagus]
MLVIGFSGRRGSERGLDYSLNRMYQLRENVAVFQMIIRLIIPLTVFFTPAVLFYTLFILPRKIDKYEFVWSLGIAMFDWWYGIMTIVTAIAYPLVDYRFQRAASHLWILRLFLPEK